MKPERHSKSEFFLSESVGKAESSQFGIDKEICIAQRKTDKTFQTRVEIIVMMH